MNLKSDIKVFVLRLRGCDVKLKQEKNQIYSSLRYEMEETSNRQHLKGKTILLFK